jgi:hypothetical protein
LVAASMAKTVVKIADADDMRLCEESQEVGYSFCE